jgi:hypothetical protein
MGHADGAAIRGPGPFVVDESSRARWWQHLVLAEPEETR